MLRGSRSKQMRFYKNLSYNIIVSVSITIKLSFFNLFGKSTKITGTSEANWTYVCHAVEFSISFV